MKLTDESKVLLGIFAATVAIVAVAVLAFSRPVKPLDRTLLLPEGAHIKGGAGAPVYLVEFSDFQCPSCKAAKPIIDSILEKQKEKLLFSYRHFPLDQHPFAVQAAMAAEAAGVQGKFWQMYDFLFENQERLSDAVITEGAAALGLDAEKFTKDLADSALRDRVAGDRADGVRFGVDATPTFFLNGTKLTLSALSDLSKEVEKVIR